MMLTTRMDVKQDLTNREIFSDPDAIKILQFMIRSARTPLTPETLPTDEIHYPDLKPLLAASTTEKVELLGRMVEAKVLVADLVDKVPACPECGSFELSTRYLCPKCFSYDIARSYLYEHLKCGKVASDDTFKKGDQLVCPKCQTVLHNFGVEYRAVGAWYKCSNCTESFNVPSHSHFCRPKHHQFASDRTRFVPIYQYRLNPDTLSQVRRELLMYSDTVATLEALGVTAMAPHELPGKSGHPQPFDIVATVKGRWGATKTIAIDVLANDAGVPAEAVRAFAAKVKDAKASESYLVAVPSLTDDAKTLARNMKISCIEGASLKEATNALLGRGAFKDLAS